MLDRPADSSLRMPPVTLARTDRSSDCSPLEEEVTGLFDQLRNPLLRYVRSFGLPPQDGEEVIQEVFLALFQHLRQGKPRHNLRGWVFRVAHNLALKQRYADGQDIWAEFEERSEVKYVDSEPNPEDALAARRRQERLIAVVRVLPEQDRYCLYLRAEGLRYRVISEVLGMSLGAISLSLTRSLARLIRADKG